MKLNQKFVTFLTGLSEHNPMLMESIITGYNIICESSENMVSNIQNTIGSNDENPLDEPMPEEMPIEGEEEMPIEGEEPLPEQPTV